MRVIGGSARGRVLRSLPQPRASRTGHLAGRAGLRPVRSVRPTSDLVRGVIFDMLDAMGASYERVLDLYAGTGALGIEALSRGEGTADFVEQDAEAARIIRANLALTGFDTRAGVHVLPVARAASRLRGAYTLVLADPPYYDTGAIAAVEAMAGPPHIADGSVLVLEHHRRTAAPDALGTMDLYRRRRHGDTVVSIYEQEGSP